MSAFFDMDGDVHDTIDAIAAPLRISREEVVALAVQMLASKLRFSGRRKPE
jgi:hypothetical protein